MIDLCAIIRIKYKSYYNWQTPSLPTKIIIIPTKIRCLEKYPGNSVDMRISPIGIKIHIYIYIYIHTYIHRYIYIYIVMHI